MRKTAAIFISFLIGASPAGFAVQHLHPGTFPFAHNDKIHTPTKAELKKGGGNFRAAIASSAVGSKMVAVIIVQFQATPPADAGLTTGSNLIQSVNNIHTYFTQMAAFYDEASYHKLSVSFKYFNSNTATVDGDAAPSPAGVGVYSLPHPIEYYGCGDEGVGCASSVNTPAPGFLNANGDYLIRDALVAARAGHSSTPANTSVGGMFDAVVVVHAGNGNETTTVLGDIWSIFYSQEPASAGGVIGSAGGGWEEGDVVPETESSGITSPLGVMCHEFGHELGLPDEYNTGVSGGTSVVGNWELMDSGPFDGNGANPSHPGAWDKQYLGWATLQVASSSTKFSASVGYSEGGANNIVKLPVANGSVQEYFLAEYRSRSSGATYDQAIPGDGLLIWHIDDAITSTRGVGITDPSLSNKVNTGQPHYGISIIPADGAAISNTNQGSSGNPFTNGQIFTAPQSNTFANQPSGITLANIHGVGSATLSYDVADFAVGPAQAIEKLINFPNPAGKGYPHPQGEGHTTLQFYLTRPASDLQINIYNLSGDLVKKIGKDDMTLNITTPSLSGDDKWVYQYVWDLTNGEGKKVAPGVYLYLLRADGKTATSKMVVIR